MKHSEAVEYPVRGTNMCGGSGAPMRTWESSEAELQSRDGSQGRGVGLFSEGRGEHLEGSGEGWIYSWDCPSWCCTEDGPEGGGPEGGGLQKGMEYLGLDQTPSVEGVLFCFLCVRAGLV